MVLTQNRLKLVVKPWSKNVLQKPEFIKTLTSVILKKSVAFLLQVWLLF